jgi:hypothetical protein
MDVVEIRLRELLALHPSTRADLWIPLLQRSGMFVELPLDTPHPPLRQIYRIRELHTALQELEVLLADTKVSDIYRQGGLGDWASGGAIFGSGVPPRVWALIGGVVALCILFFGYAQGFPLSFVVLGFLAILGLVAVVRSDLRRNRLLKSLEAEREDVRLELSAGLSRLSGQNFAYCQGRRLLLCLPARLELEDDLAAAQRGGSDTVLQEAIDRLRDFDARIAGFRRIPKPGFTDLSAWARASP